MADDTGDFGLTASANLTIQALDKIEAAGPELPAPAQIPDTVLPVLVAGKGRNGVGGVTDEAADGVGVEAEEEGDEEVVGVPEGLE